MISLAWISESAFTLCVVGALRSRNVHWYGAAAAIADVDEKSIAAAINMLRCRIICQVSCSGEGSAAGWPLQPSVVAMPRLVRSLEHHRMTRVEGRCRDLSQLCREAESLTL